MARALAAEGRRTEKDLVLEFEEAAFLTLGICYEKRGRFSGGAYHFILKKVDGFLDLPLPKALEIREERAAKLLELDDAVVEAVAGLKERGFVSPYLKAFVVARVNYLRFVKGDMPSFDAALARILASASKFDVSKIKESQVAAAAGPPEESPG
jgi:ParB family chromosome partitioning protein